MPLLLLGVGFGVGILAGFVRDCITKKAVETAQDRLDTLIKNCIVSILCKLPIYFAAIFISFIDLFGQTVSILISSIIISLVTLYSLIKFMLKIPFIVQFPLKILLQGATPVEAISDYIMRTHPFIFGCYGFLEFIGFAPVKDDLAVEVWAHVGKQVSVFIVSIGLYFIAFYLIVRCRLQPAAMGVSGLKVYLLPFSTAIDCIFKTNTMGWIMGY